MELTYLFLLALTVLLIINNILTLKTGKKESGNELTEIKSLTEVFTSTLSTPLHLLNFSFG